MIQDYKTGDGTSHLNHAVCAPVQHMQLIDDMSSKRSSGLRPISNHAHCSIHRRIILSYAQTINISPQGWFTGKYYAMIRQTPAGMQQIYDKYYVPIIFYTGTEQQIPACSEDKTVCARVIFSIIDHGWWYTCNWTFFWMLFLFDSPYFILLKIVNNYWKTI